MPYIVKKMIERQRRMNRCELKCYMCNITIGYMSVIADDNLGIIRSTQNMRSGEKFPICCPICEARRSQIDMQGEKE